MEHGGVNIEVEGNAPMEKYDSEVENTIEDVGIGVVDNLPENRIEANVIGATDEDDDSCASNDDDEENHDIPIIEKENEPLYQGSQTTLLSNVLLLVNFKVMNGISNVAISCSVIFVIFYVSVPLIFFILTMFFHRLIGECYHHQTSYLAFTENY